MHPFQRSPFDGTAPGIYIGTSIGNFPAEEARLNLRDLRDQLQTGDALFQGTGKSPQKTPLSQVVKSR